MAEYPMFIPTLYHQTCDSCGQKIWVRNPLTRCLVCNQSICETCNQHGFCAPDFFKLKGSQQTAMHNIDKNTDRKQLYLGLTMMIGLPAIFILAFFILGTTVTTFYWGIGFILMGLLLLGGMIAAYVVLDFRRDSEKIRIAKQDLSVQIPDFLEEKEKERKKPKQEYFARRHEYLLSNH